MITRNFEDFPEHRTHFFELLLAVNAHYFASIFSLPRDIQKLIVDSIIWAVKHTDRMVADTGLKTLLALLLNIHSDSQIAPGFYRSFHLVLVQDVLAVLTDRLHKPGFKLHAAILSHLFSVVTQNEVSVPLWESILNQTTIPTGTTNSVKTGHDVLLTSLWAHDHRLHPVPQTFLRDYIEELVGASFTSLSPSQVIEFVGGCFRLCNDLPAFRTRLRDFLVSVKGFVSEDNVDLVIESDEMVDL